jgi:hypothetical protein
VKALTQEERDNMKVSIEGGELVIRLPLHNPPLPSTSGIM